MHLHGVAQIKNGRQYEKDNFAISSVNFLVGWLSTSAANKNVLNYVRFHIASKRPMFA